MEFKNLLIQWRLSDYISAFENEGIDDDSFKLIDEATIEKIFLKSGPKLLFKRNFQEYLNHDMMILENTSETDKRELPTASSESTSYILTPEHPSDSQPYEIEFIDLLTSPQRCSVTSPSSSSNVSKRSLDLDLEDINNTKKAKDSIIPQGLTRLLENDRTDGSIILANRFKLNNDHRQKLCKLIISDLIKTQGTEIRGSTFLKVSEEITDIFPNENIETYYIPYVPGGKHNKGIGPKGKLWSRYVNVKVALRLANSQKQVNEPKRDISPITDSETSSLAFLKVGTEPFTKVLEAWESTFKLRKKLYLNSPLSDILAEFPCLKLNCGVELIETDYNRRFSEKIDIIYSRWPIVCASIIKEGNERKIRQDHPNTDKNVQALLLLPYLFSPVNLKKSRKGGCWRPTRSEIQESFFFHVKNFDVVGDPDSVEPLEFYILVEDVIYKVDTPIRQLELLYKLFHGLDVEYPIESEHVWLFIQEMVFMTKSNKKCPSTSSMIANIQYHVNESNVGNLSN